MTRSIAFTIGVALWLAPTAVWGQVVQLPTFHSFSVSTTVVVPDRGVATLGGVRRSAYGSSSHGVPGLGGLPGAGRLFRNTARGADVSSSGVTATATIMDLNELDQVVLAEARQRRAGLVASGGAPTTSPATSRQAAFLAQHMGRTSDPPTPLARQPASRAAGVTRTK